MEQTILPDNHIPQNLLPEKAILPHTEPQNETPSTAKPFIEANTLASSLGEISEKHIIPVFIKDNETNEVQGTGELLILPHTSV
jgi:hypothetical protein